MKYLLDGVLALSTSCSATLLTLGFLSNFQLVEQLSVHRAMFKFLCLDDHSHAHATCETIKEVQNVACVENILVQYFSFTIS